MVTARLDGPLGLSPVVVPARGGIAAKLGLFRWQGRRLGIGGKLLLALVAIAGTTVAASGIGWLHFAWIERTIVDITEGSLPTMILAEGLKAESAAIAAAGPVLAAAGNLQERGVALQPLLEHRDAMTALLSQLRRRPSVTADLDALQQAVDRIVATLDRQVALLDRRLSVRERRLLLIDEIALVHDTFLDALAPVRDQAGAHLIEAAAGLRTTTETAVRALTVDLNAVQLAVLELTADSHLTAALALRTINAPLEEQYRLFSHYVEATARMSRQMGRLDQIAEGGRLRQLVESLVQLGIGPTSVFALSRRRSTPGLSPAERQALDADLAESWRAVDSVHRALTENLAPAVVRARAEIFRTGAGLNRATNAAIERLLGRGVDDLTTVLELASTGNLIAGLLNEAAQVMTRDRLDRLAHRFDTAAAGMTAQLAGLPSEPGFAAFRRLGTSLVGFGGTGDHNLFTIRRTELDLEAEGQRLLDDNRLMAHDLALRVDGLLAAAQNAIANDTDLAEWVLRVSLVILAGFAAASLAVAAAVGWAYVWQSIVCRLNRLAAATRRIAGGETAAEIERTGNDEITDMSDALVIFRDATRQLGERTEALRQSEERLRHILETSPVGISILTEDLTTCLFTNSSFRRLFDREDGAEGLDPTDRGRVLAELTDRGRIEGMELRHRRCDGGVSWVLLDVGPIRYAGQPALLAWHYDISQRKLSEEAHLAARDQAERALMELRGAQEQLIQSEKLASLGGIVAGVAHEINTPIGIALTGATMLTDRMTELRRLVAGNQLKRSDFDRFLDTAEEASRLILANIERSAQLVQSFKQVSIDQTSDERRVFNMKLYLDEVVTSLGPVWRRAGHRVELQCPDDLLVDGFPGGISQILTNFVTNSVNHGFAPGEMGTLRVTVHAIEGDQIELTYSDDGRGIPLALRRKIFDPFFTTRRSEGSTGLGLNVVYNLVTGKLHGQIAVEDRETGRGIRFLVRFPRIVPG